jgi:hypothetical protein
MTRYVVAGFIAFFACLGLLGVKVAMAHSWYDAACCSEKDCAPIPDSDVADLGAGGFYIHSRKEHIALKDTRQGKDENYHLCVNQATNARLCFYRKFNGS